MFFNEDILFRNGSLALVWIAGNEEFRNKKGKRSKEFQSVLKANVSTICKDLRALFPDMGSAYGLSLKKMGTLVRGVGIIYSIKMDQFSRDVYQATIALKRPFCIPTHKIDAPRGTSAKTKVGAKQINAAAEDVTTIAFGGLREMEFDEGIPEDFGNLDSADMFGTPRAFPSRRLSRSSIDDRGTPRRLQFTPPRDLSNEDTDENNQQRRERSSRKRRREENDEEEMYRDVCRRLQTGMAENLDAHCLREEDNGLLPEDNEPGQNEFDFGDGMDLLNGLADPNVGVPEQPSEPAPVAPEEAVGPPTGIEFEDPSNVMATPPSARTRAENRRGRRNGDAELLNLSDIEISSGSSRRMARRRRLRFTVDLQTQFSLEDILHRINTVKEATKPSELDKLLVKTRAPGKSSWKFCRSTADNLIFTTAGNCYPSRILNEMVREITTGQLRMPEKKSYERTDESISIEQQRGDGGDMSSNIAGISSVTADLAAAQDGPCLAPLEEEPVPVPAKQYDAQQQPYDGMQLDNQVGVEQGVRDVAPTDIMEEEMDPFRIPDVPQRKKSRASRADEQSHLSNRLDGTNSFGDLYPPGQVNRKKAAWAFAILLKMQSKKEVLLHEDEPYGQIRIERLKV